MYTPDKIAGCGGDELPIKVAKRFENPTEITREQFMKLNSGFLGSAWGSVVNNPCELWQTASGQIIEVYCSFGWLYCFYTEGK